MASTTPIGDIATLPAAVGRALALYATDGAPIAVALSGGRDSVALLDAVIDGAPAHGLAVTAIHIHHGLSAHADAWARFCVELCAARAVPLLERRVDVARGARKSVEAEARRSRYAALSAAAIESGIQAVLLAHHQDDQAETVLLQLLRGAGPHGLAAMPIARTDATGILWLRPLLDVPRAVINAYIEARGLPFVDDDSNTDVRYARNALREQVIPALAKMAPGYPATVARAAQLEAEAAALIDDLAAIDAKSACDGTTLSREALCSMPPHRGRNLLRWFLRQRGLPPPSARRLDAMYAQLKDARIDGHTRLSHAGFELGIHRARIVVHRSPPPPFNLRWDGEVTLVLPHGTLRFVPVHGRGIAAAHLAGPDVVIRSRRGGERMQLSADRPARAVKSLLREAGIPEWTRHGLPLVWCGEALAAIPGVGVDQRFAAAESAAGLDPVWTER